MHHPAPSRWPVSHEPVPARVRPEAFLVLLVLLGSTPLQSSAQAPDSARVSSPDEPQRHAANAATSALPAQAASEHAALCAAARTAVVAGLLAESDAVRDARFAEARDAAARAVRLAPHSPDAQHAMAVALGVSVEGASIRQQLELGRRAAEHARAALALDPEHAGAHHVLGRINAEAMRLSGFQRTVAGRVLGSRLMREASWQKAVHHLELAATYEPQAMVHRLELARVYRDIGRLDSARELLRWVASREPTDPWEEELRGNAAADLAALGG